MVDDKEMEGWNEYNDVNVQSLFNWAVISFAFLAAMFGVLTFLRAGLSYAFETVYFIAYVVLLLGLVGGIHIVLVCLKEIRKWRTVFCEYYGAYPELVSRFKHSPVEDWAVKNSSNERLVLGLFALLSVVVFVVRSYS